MSTLTRSPRRRYLAGVAAIAAAAALVVAGCGDDNTTGAEPGSVASFVPATAPMYVEVSTEFDGAQWTQLKALGKKFPAFPDVEKQFADSLASEGVNFEKDIKPLLGDDAAVAVLQVPKTGIPSIPTSTEGLSLPTPTVPSLNEQAVVGALALAPDAEAKVVELIKKDSTVGGKIGDVEYYKGGGDDTTLVAVTDGALVVASREADLRAALEAHDQGGDRTFAGNEKARDTLAKLPDEVLMQAYLDIGTLVKQSTGDSAQLKQLETLGLNPDMAVAFSLSAETTGLRIKGVTVGANSELLAASPPFAPSLTANVPGDAVAYVGFSNLTGTAERLIETVGKTNPDVQKQLQAASGQLPVLLGGATLDDLKALGEGEHAVVVTKGTAAPVASILLQVKDGARAKKTLDGLANALPLIASQIRSGTDIPAWEPVTEAGNEGRQLPLNERFGVVYGVKDGLAVVGTQPSSLGLLNAPATGLAKDADFTAAAAGMPDQVTSLAWVDIKAAVEVADSLGAFKNAGENAQKARENLGPLKSLVMWSTVEDGTPTVEAFLTIE
jgi:hypothetical protein